MSRPTITPAFLRTYRKHAFVGILIIAAVLIAVTWVVGVVIT